MAETDITSKDLIKEIDALRKERASLEAQIAFHQKILQKIGESLSLLHQIKEQTGNNDLVKKLLKENKHLNNRLKIEQLTNREKEVLKYISNGYSSREIAQQLDISKLTVDTYRKHIQKKLKASNVVDLVRMVMESGFG